MAGLQVKPYREKITGAGITPTCYSILIRNIGSANGTFKDISTADKILEPDEEVTYTAPSGKMIAPFNFNSSATQFLIQAVI
jgi:hypothetical protein